MIETAITCCFAVVDKKGIVSNFLLCQKFQMEKNKLPKIAITCTEAVSKWVWNSDEMQNINILQ